MPVPIPFFWPIKCIQRKFPWSWTKKESLRLTLTPANQKKTKYHIKFLENGKESEENKRINRCKKMQKDSAKNKKNVELYVFFHCTNQSLKILYFPLSILDNHNTGVQNKRKKNHLKVLEKDQESKANTKRGFIKLTKTTLPENLFHGIPGLEGCLRQHGIWQRRKSLCLARPAFPRPPSWNGLNQVREHSCKKANKSGL